MKKEIKAPNESVFVSFFVSSMVSPENSAWFEETCDVPKGCALSSLRFIIGRNLEEVRIQVLLCISLCRCILNHSIQVQVLDSIFCLSFFVGRMNLNLCKFGCILSFSIIN